MLLSRRRLELPAGSHGKEPHHVHVCARRGSQRYRARRRTDNAGGALIHRFDGSAKSTPVLRFQWKVGNVIARSDPTTKAGDDYAARIYVTFAYDPRAATMREKAENSVAHMLYGETPPHAALSYVFTRTRSAATASSPVRTHRVKSWWSMTILGQSASGGSSNAISTTTTGAPSTRNPPAFRGSPDGGHRQHRRARPLALRRYHAAGTLNWVPRGGCVQCGVIFNAASTPQDAIRASACSCPAILHRPAQRRQLAAQTISFRPVFGVAGRPACIGNARTSAGNILDLGYPARKSKTERFVELEQGGFLHALPRGPT